MRIRKHLSINIDGCSRNFKGRKMAGLFDDENGNPMSDKDILKMGLCTTKVSLLK